MANGDVIIKILGDDTDLNKKLKGVGGMASTAMKAVAAGAAAAGATVAALGKSALDAYASYEQLAGGVQTLFGESAAATVSKYAAEAYKTAGMSANAYMETVTSVSASLMQSLGGDAEAAATEHIFNIALTVDDLFFLSQDHAGTSVVHVDYDGCNLRMQLQQGFHKVILGWHNGGCQYQHHHDLTGGMAGAHQYMAQQSVPGILIKRADLKRFEQASD